MSDTVLQLFERFNWSYESVAIGIFKEFKMSGSIEPPPAFVSDVKSFAEYKSDLEMWSRITSLDKKLQAETIL